MKIPKGCLIQLLCSTDETRAVINHAYLEIVNGVGTLCVTDGRRLMRLRVELSEGDEEGYVPKRALELAQAHRTPEILCGKESLVIAGANKLTMERPSVSRMGKYPNTQAPSLAPKEGTRMKVCLNAELLVDIQRAAGATCVQLEVHAETDPLIVTPGQNYQTGKLSDHVAVLDAHILLMPVRLMP